MTSKEAFDNQNKRAVEKHWWLFLILLIALLIPPYYAVPLLKNKEHQFLAELFFFAYLFFTVFVGCLGYAIALRRTKFTKEEKAALLDDVINIINKKNQQP